MALSFMYTSFHQVKRLFDTFHEPFKRVESSRQPIPEASVQNNAEPSSLNQDEQTDAEETSNQKEKEPELTVKSALSAAFSKYAERVRKRKNTSQGEEKGESSVDLKSKTEKKKSKWSSILRCFVI